MHFCIACLQKNHRTADIDQSLTMTYSTMIVLYKYAESIPTHGAGYSTINSILIN